MNAKDTNRYEDTASLHAQLEELTRERDETNRILEVIVEAFEGIKPSDEYPFAGEVFELQAEAARLRKVLEKIPRTCRIAVERMAAQELRSTSWA